MLKRNFDGCAPASTATPAPLAVHSPVVPPLFLALIVPPFAAAQGSRIMQDDASQFEGTGVWPRNDMNEGIAMDIDDMKPCL